MSFAPLKIGSACVPAVVGAPMAGVTDEPMRRVIRGFGGELLFTEMILAASLVHAHKQTRKMALCCETDDPVGVQIEGTDPEVMARAARIIEENGRAVLIDINMGCPVPKIVKSGGGAALMNDPERAEKIVKAVVSAVRLPVTVKFRLGWDENRLNYRDFALRMQDAGAAAVTLHARTRRQFYGGAADRAAVGELKKILSVPVIANGDIRVPDDAEKVLSETGADAVMIGRGLLGKPWILSRCSAALEGRKIFDPPDVCRVVLDHFDKMTKYYGHKAIFIARKHIAWYSLGMKGGSAFREKVNNTVREAELLSLIREFFGGSHEISK